ncbi:hypothetical protein ACFL3V_00385 [Nanoarchaeota archaeon]
MEQYLVPRYKDFENLRTCLDNYTAEHLFIRLVGSVGGTVKVNENLDGRVLDFSRDDSGLHLLVDSSEVFHFPLEGYDSELTKGFSVAYERYRMVDGGERMVMLGRGVDPYDPALPEPERSVLRHVLDDHLIEITFSGRVELEFDSWWQKPHWKYWRIVE